MTINNLKEILDKAIEKGNGNCEVKICDGYGWNEVQEVYDEADGVIVLYNNDN